MALEKSLAWKAESPCFLEFSVSCIWSVHTWNESCVAKEGHKGKNTTYKVSEGQA